MSATPIKLRSTVGTIRVNRASGIVHDVAIAHAGQARGYDFQLDALTLLGLKAAIESAPTPMRLTHPRDGGDDPLPTIVGEIRNPRIVGGVLRGDVHLLDSARDRDFVLELCERLPESVGLSIDFVPTWETRNGVRFARVARLNAVDFVSEPAANPRGLLQKGSSNMEALIAYLKTLGLPEDVTDETAVVAWLKGRFGEPTGDAATGDPAGEALSAGGGVATLAMNAVKAERLRVTSIRNMAREMKVGDPTFVDRCIEQGLSVAEAGTQAIQLRMREDGENTPTIRLGARAAAPANSGDILTAATLIHLGRGKLTEKMGSHTVEAARRLNIRSAHDLCRAAIQLAGRSDQVNGNGESVIRLAFSNSSLPTALGASADKILEASYLETPASWRSWCGRRTVANLREHTGIRPYLNQGGLEELGPGGEIKHSSLNEETFTFQARTFAKMFSVTRHAILNDDLSSIDQLFGEFGRQAAEKTADLIYEALLGNAGSFFAAGHSNLLDGADSVLGITALAEAFAAIRKQTDAAGRPISLVPQVLVVAPENEITALQIVGSELMSRDVSTIDNQPQGNPFKGKLIVEVEPRLSNATFHSSASDLLWFLFCGPVTPCVSAVFLQGKETPTVETADSDFERLGMQMRGYLDVGAALTDYRAGVMSAGE